MKLIVKQGNLLDVTQGHIVHGCNAQGVMGSGVALAVKKKFLGAYLSYKNIHESERLVTGCVYPWKAGNNLIIWNAITQEYFGLPGRNCSYDAIESCFRGINEAITVGCGEVPEEIHIPMIGAGLGGGNWNIIQTIIEETVIYPTTVWVL